MADEIRVTDTHGTPAPLTTRADVDVERAAPIADDPDAARAEIQSTRARMSETINEIEEVLVRRKEQIQDKLDVLSPVKENPLPSAGIAFGAGLLLGLLTGGGDSEWEGAGRSGRNDRWSRSTAEEWGRASSGHWGAASGVAGSAAAWDDQDDDYWQRRAETWESRARRLRDVARQQEEEIRALQEQWGEQRATSFEPDGRDRKDRERGEEDDGTGFFASSLDELRSTIGTGLSRFIVNAVRDLTGQGSRAGT